MMTQQAKVAVVMGSTSDWQTMTHSAQCLSALAIPHQCQIVSAHRTPDRLFHFAETAAETGFQVIIAGAGGAAHLPGMLAAKTALPVIGVPVAAGKLVGVDAMLSIGQMPAGVPVATMAIGEAGAKNAALLATSILALADDEIAQRLHAFRQHQTEQVLTQADAFTWP